MPDHNGMTRRQGGYYSMRDHYGTYLTEEHWKIAESNGIKMRALANRINFLGWAIERAITEPLMKDKQIRQYAQLAQENGLNLKTYYSRVKRGWSFERAATTPKVVRGGKFDKELVKLAEYNGISRHAFWNRVVKQGMTEYEAATTPKMSVEERLAKGRAKSSAKYSIDLHWQYMKGQV